MNKLIIQVKVVLDETQFGYVKEDLTKSLFDFNSNHNEKKEFITRRRGSTLIAVTKQQANTWNKWNIIAEKINI